MRLFIFHDGIEEIIVAANDRNDAFQVIEETFGKDAADELVGSHLSEYPDDFFFVSMTAKEVASHGRRIVAQNLPNTYPKPKEQSHVVH